MPAKRLTPVRLRGRMVPLAINAAPSEAGQSLRRSKASSSVSERAMTSISIPVGSSSPSSSASSATSGSSAAISIAIMSSTAISCASSAAAIAASFMVAAAIAADGPFILSDVSGSGQRLPIYLSHTGDDPETGWNVIEAHPPDTPDDCFLRWSTKRHLFETTCNDATYPEDGGSLNHYSWTVDKNGSLLIDLRKPLGGRVTTTTAG